MRPLYEIEADILSCVDMETGEIIDTDKLEALELERDKKIEGVILWRKDLLAEAEAVRKEAQNLTNRARVAENKAESLKGYIEHVLAGDKFKTERCSVSYRKSSKIVIDDVKALPVAVWKDVTEDWISKSKIKEMLEAGQEVKGAHQEDGKITIIK